MKKYFYFLFALIILSACGTYSDDQKKLFDTQIEQYLDSLGKDGFKRLESGLYYKIIEKGNTEQSVKYTDNVDIYYTGSLLNGEVFQSIKEEEALNFNVNQLIVGWQDALCLIGEGGKIEVYIPPYLGYGDRKTEKIPQNSVIHFVLGVKKVI